MILMQLRNIIKSFQGDNIILNKVNIEVQTNEKIAIVGRNGAGKSTLLKIMTGELPYDDGEMFIHRDIEVGYLAQHNDLQSDNTIWDEMLNVFTHLLDEEKQLLQLAEKIEQVSNKDNYDEKLTYEYSRRQEQFADNGGYRFKSDIKGVLTGLGFNEEEFDLPIQALSGGQKTRIALGKLLLTNPDLLILDEPTNHLDIATLTWLENFLLNYNGAIIIVSHDRYFLDKIVSIVYEVAHQQTFKYHGNYSNYLEEKAMNYERELKMYEKQQAEIKATEEFIQRNIARASTSKRAQSRRTQLERMTRIEKPLQDQATANIAFQVAKTSGNDVIHVDHLTYQYQTNDEPVFTDVSFHIYRGERVALIGANGVGKTTLLKALISHHHENIRIGTNVQIGYYAQEQEKLTDSKTVLYELWDEYPNKTEQEIRTILGSFLFSGEDVDKYVYTLSGGEKARLALAKLMMEQANLLILDEPTNHLDLASKEVLENALYSFPGTILFVSHDRYFMNKLADKVLHLEKNGVTQYLGNYDYFIEKQLELEEIAKLEGTKESKSEMIDKSIQHLSYEEKKRMQSEQRKVERKLSQLEEEIETLEQTLQDKELAMTDPLVLNDHEALLSLAEDCELLKQQLEEKIEEWTLLQE